MQIVGQGNADSHKGAVLALGVFDGVHLGHQALFKEAIDVSRKLGVSSMAATFHPHPKTLVAGFDSSKSLLTPAEEKMALIEHSGLDYFWPISFTKQLADTSPEDFVADYLAGVIGARHVVCGFNFSFGKGGMGKAEQLLDLGPKYGFTVSVVSPVEVGREVVSSTRIRRCLDDGSLREAWDCLTRPYCVYGTVKRGDGRGKTIGLPTCNLDLPKVKALPGKGVYSALARAIDPKGQTGHEILEKPSVVNIGTRPTFNGQDIRVEVHIPGFRGDLYGEKLQVFLTGKIRDEKAFQSGAHLREQVQKDILAAVSEPWDSFTVPKVYDKMLSLKVP